MIVPMKKASLIVLESEKKAALKKLRKLGLLHIEISEGAGQHMIELREQTGALEKAISLLSDYAAKDAIQSTQSNEDAVLIAKNTFELIDEKESLNASLAIHQAELDRLSSWGELDPSQLDELRNSGVPLSVYEMPLSEYKKLDDSIITVALDKTKYSVRFIATASDDKLDAINQFKFKMPQKSTEALKNDISLIKARLKEIDNTLGEYALCTDIMKTEMAELQKETQFEIYDTGMERTALSQSLKNGAAIAYLVGYLPAADEEKLFTLAKENSWGLMMQDPTPDDNAPTQLHNNKFVSLIYPLTSFLGTVPGYFEYDISGWFLGFILVFFGIIFGDGGYGLLICAGVGIPIIKNLIQKKPVAPAFLLIELMGAATVLWGVLTCTWFGLSPELLPSWLCKLSVPVISNVYADKIWYPFWTNGAAGLTTTQNIQIFCFALALIQLSAAHIQCGVRNRKSLKILGDIGSVFQLIGVFYVVLSLVVNGAVFGLGLTIGGFPVGITAIAMVGVGFVMSFVFSNYEGKLGESVMSSIKNIVSVLLGVINVFSDIVSYIRLWAVGLAGAAISATVNELASPMLGNFMFIIFAIVILVFGHGLNMILNVLSVIVHGVRLNTLEFSTHLDMSWGGHKYEPFKE